MAVSLIKIKEHFFLLDGIKILIVEDNLLNQKIVTFILQKQKALVHGVMNGKEAIRLLTETAFDVILMDLQMPEMDGYSAIKHIREEMKITVPIIALTAGLFADESRDYERIGTNACVSKPIDPAGLVELIAKLIKENKN